MDVLEAIRTTRAMGRLDPARDVSEAGLWPIVEAATKAILRIPDEVQTFAMVTVGNPLGRWGDAPRRPTEVAFWDRWGATSADGGNDHV